MASAQNDTHSIILVLKGVPPELIGVELYGNDDSAFVLSIEKGDDVELSLKPDLPRAAIEINVEGPVQLLDGTTKWGGYVPLGITSEGDATELSFQVIEADSTIVEFNLADLTSNQTDVHGDWWDFIYWDYSGDGYFSASDYYEIRTNSTNSVSIKTYDSWADTWAGDITPSNG